MNTTTTPSTSEVAFVYPVEHRDRAFCDDLEHQCHFNGHNVAELNKAVDEGLITEDEATLIIIGRTV